MLSSEVVLSVSPCLCGEMLFLPMKIEAITLREIHMPLVHFFETSFGRTYSRRILLVTVHAEGVEGAGANASPEKIPSTAANGSKAPGRR